MPPLLPTLVRIYCGDRLCEVRTTSAVGGRLVCSCCGADVSRLVAW